MPIYEYHCGSCEHDFEVMQKIKTAPIKICPKCSQETVTRLVSAAGFQLKGTGWYATDFKDKGKAPSKDQSTKSDVKKDKDVNVSSSKATPAAPATNTGVKKERTDK